MALYLLDGSGDPEFKRVLNWAAEYDTNELVGQMAQALLKSQPSQIIQRSDSDPLSEILSQ